MKKFTDKEKFFFVVLVIVLFVIVLSNSQRTDDSKDVLDKIWTFTMKYGEENLGYSIENQINLLVIGMKAQGYRCWITQKYVKHLGNELYSVSLVVVIPNTDEKCEYSWRTDMRSKIVTPISYYAKLLTYQ